VGPPIVMRQFVCNKRHLRRGRCAHMLQKSSRIKRHLRCSRKTNERDTNQAIDCDILSLWDVVSVKYGWKISCLTISLSRILTFSILFTSPSRLCVCGYSMERIWCFLVRSVTHLLECHEVRHVKLSTLFNANCVLVLCWLVGFWKESLLKKKDTLLKIEDIVWLKFDKC